MIIASIFPVALLALGFLFYVNTRTLMYLTIVSIFFPVILPFAGRDAITTGTITILLMFTRLLADSYKYKKSPVAKLDKWVYLLILLGTVSTAYTVWTGSLDQELIGEAVRKHVNFTSALLFFLVIRMYHADRIRAGSGRGSHIETMLSVILMLVSVHIFLSILVKLFPAAGVAFKIFLPRVQDTLDIVGRGDIERITSFTFSHEAYGEILAVLSPVVMYKFYKDKNLVWMAVLFLFAIGEIFSVTRSGIALFIIGVAASLLYHSIKKMEKTLALTLIGLTGSAILISIHPSILSDVALRFKDATDTYSSTGSIFDSINRGFFRETWVLVVTHLTWFGNGPLRTGFHNLFLTVVHQLGIVGAFVFFWILLYPLVELIRLHKNNPRSSIDRALVFSCILSMVLFLINETKFEFTRHASYQQICWGLFALYYSISQTALNEVHQRIPAAGLKFHNGAASPHEKKIWWTPPEKAN